MATVNHLVLRRDVGTLTFDQGTLSLLALAGGTPIGAVFSGRGRFTLSPPDPTEQAELLRRTGSPHVDLPVTEAILLFADSTPEALEALSFGTGDARSDVVSHVQDFLGSLKGTHEGSYWNSVLEPLLDDTRNGFFLARVTPATGDPMLFEIDPAETQAVRLFRPAGHTKSRSDWTLLTEFDNGRAPDTAAAWNNRERLSVPHYRIEVTLTPAGTGADLGFAANATLSLVARETIGPWLRFGLDGRLLVDSARWGEGTGGRDRAAATVFKAKDDGTLWIRAARSLQSGDSLSLTVFYHGDLIDRYGDWFFIDPSADWFPTNGQGGTLATFELTFHSPSRYPLATIGERTDSSAAGKVMTTHWVADRPTESASFNLGLFETNRVQQRDRPALDVLISGDTHMRGGGDVATDVGNSLQYFAALFGPPEFDHFVVTEIPYGEGVSFPGLIHLSWATFQFPQLDGFDEWFRAHEVAHQWWGNGVRNGSYRDKWLSEGLASFSALWYLQHERQRDDEYYKFLDRYKTDITSLPEAGPIWIGYRNNDPNTPQAYHVTVYEKGAWVFHMLRVLMLDLSTLQEDRFTATLRDYYASYKDKPGTAEGFKRIVERHAGVAMDWFFDEWIKGTGIPTYHVAWKSEPAENGRYRVRFRVSQNNVPPDFQMPVVVSADLGEQRTARFRITVRGPQGEYVSPLLPAPAETVDFNEFGSVLGEVKMEKW